MEPHKRIWLDEEERAKTMSGSVHKPQPSVLLTKGPDTLVQQVSGWSLDEGRNSRERRGVECDWGSGHFSFASAQDSALTHEPPLTLL